MVAQIARRRFSIDEYHQMVETGIISSIDRVELIDGEVIEMSPIGRKHAATVARLDKLWQQRLGNRVLIWVQNPIYLSNTSEPQPDLALLKPRDDFYMSALPTPQDILLVVEVADSTISYDREVKMSLYSAAGITEAWLFDLNKQSIEAYTKPGESGYKQIRRFEQGDIFSILAFPDFSFSWVDVFGLEA